MAQQIVLYAVIRGRADRQPREAWEKVSGSFKTQGYLKNEEGCLFQVAFYPIRIANERKPGKAAGCRQYAHTARRGTQHFGHQPAKLPETKAPFPALPIKKVACNRNGHHLPS